MQNSIISALNNSRRIPLFIPFIARGARAQIPGGGAVESNAVALDVPFQYYQYLICSTQNRFPESSLLMNAGPCVILLSLGCG